MKFLQIQTNMLRFIGYFIENRNSVLCNLYANTCFALLAIITIPEIHFVVENLSDIPLATDGLCTLLTCFLSLSKLLTFKFKRNQFYLMIDILRGLWMKTAASDERGHLNDAHQKGDRLTKFYIVSSFTAGLLFLSIPLGQFGYELLTTGNTTWTMPMRSVFVYDIHKHPNYELTFGWFVQTTLTAIIGSTTIDSLFYAAAFNLSAHFRIVQFRMRHMIFEEKNGKAVRLSHQFRRTIQYHTKVIELATRLTDIYRPIMFAQFMVASLQICVIVYQITLISPGFMLDFIRYAMFLVAILFQCFVYCHGGTQLWTESITVADAIYGSSWYTTTISTRQTICFFLARSQKPIKVSAGFFNANLESFKAIISTAGSYITLLQTMSKN